MPITGLKSDWSERLSLFALSGLSTVADDRLMWVDPASLRHSTATTRSATIVDLWVRPNVSSIHRPLLLREHQVQVLHRSAGCAFSEIIENRR
jgi:hypothetical protein